MKWRWVGAAVLAGAGLWLFSGTAPDGGRAEAISPLVLAADGGVLRGFLARDERWRLPAGVANVDPLYLTLLEAAEDHRFRRHYGVDPLAVLRATAQMLRHGRVISGASTLTMQSVRLLEPRSRTLWAKLAEMRAALALERGRDKDAILGLYLTLAPFGGNLEGVRAASLAYFGKEPTRLTLGEAALLVALPQSPERLRPDRHPQAAAAARNRLLARLAARGTISAADAAEAQAEPVPTTRQPLPSLAPHLAWSLHRAAPTRRAITSTINAGLQAQVEQRLAREIADLDPQATIAAVIVAIDGRRVVAHVGNAAPHDTGRAGAVDVTRAARSPGSALKPFIYALAFDQQLIHPETLFVDRPRFIAGYAPRNFDARFHGEVTAREALQDSLNVPAVQLIDRLGPRTVAETAGAAGIRFVWPTPSSAPTLPLALGGVGISLWDLALLYAALADGGKALPLRADAEASQPAPMSLVGPRAAAAVRDVLLDAPPPPGVTANAMRKGRQLAVKTGTSYGYRDALAVGWDHEYVIAIWVGRPDGTPRPGQFGRLTAAPLVFKLAELLPAPIFRASRPRPVMMRNQDLPPALRRFDDRLALDRAADTAPQILFPPRDARIAWDGASPIRLEATGGSGALRWLVNGQPLPADPRRAHSRTQSFWRPDAYGFAELTVIDAAGQASSVAVRVVE